MVHKLGSPEPEEGGKNMVEVNKFDRFDMCVFIKF